MVTFFWRAICLRLDQTTKISRFNLINGRSKKWICKLGGYSLSHIQLSPQRLARMCYLLLKKQCNITIRLQSYLYWGALVVSCLLLFLVAIGAWTLLAQSPILFIVLKIFGGSYLIYLGFRGLVSNKSSGTEQEILRKPQKIKLPTAHLNGFMVSASNLKR